MSSSLGGSIINGQQIYSLIFLLLIIIDKKTKQERDGGIGIGGIGFHDPRHHEYRDGTDKYIRIIIIIIMGSWRRVS
jgi:hypothetical protein